MGNFYFDAPFAYYIIALKFSPIPKPIPVVMEFIPGFLQILSLYPMFQVSEVLDSSKCYDGFVIALCSSSGKLMFSIEKVGISNPKSANSSIKLSLTACSTSIFVKSMAAHPVLQLCW